MLECPICNSSGSIFDLGSDRVDCSRCGKYRITETAVNLVAEGIKGDKRKIANASGWVREHQNELISSDSIQQLLDLSTPSLAEKSLYILKHLEKLTTFLGQKIAYDTSFLAIARALNDKEFKFVFNFLKENAYVTFQEYFDGDLSDFCITPAGFSYLDRIKNSNTDSHVGFCAMWFDESVKNIWNNAISPAILDAGYEPKRIDEHPHNNRIDDEIIALIRRSRFVVADFTGQRGGVYFEAGYALGMNLPVIWTVKKSELASVHFDNRQYNFVTWEENNLPEFKLNLQYRIEATLGRGKYQP